MSALTSLLSRDRVVSIQKIEQALQRQVVSGGALDTAVLELALVPEDLLSAYMGAVHGLLPATRDEVMRVPRDTVRLGSVELVSEYRFLPLRLDGRELLVAVTKPFTEDAERRLAATIGYALVPRIITEVRLWTGLAHHYGIEVPPRLRRLAERLRNEDPGTVRYVAPLEGRSASHPPPAPSRPSFESLREESDRPSRDPDLTIPAPPPEEYARDLVSAPLVNVASSPSYRPSKQPQEGSQSVRFSTLSTSPELRSRLRRPLSVKDLDELLAKAAGRDDIVEIYFAFARQYFEYTALFVIHGDLAEGRLSFGPGVGNDEVVKIAVPLDLPSSFSDTRATAQARTTYMDSHELDTVILRDLGRVSRTPAALVPVTLKGRAVCVLYGDRGGEMLELSDLPELTAASQRAGLAFERLLLRKKAPVLQPTEARTALGLSRPAPEPPSWNARLSQAPLTGSAPESLRPLADVRAHESSYHVREPITDVVQVPRRAEPRTAPRVEARSTPPRSVPVSLKRESEPASKRDSMPTLTDALVQELRGVSMFPSRDTLTDVVVPRRFNPRSEPTVIIDDSETEEHVLELVATILQSDQDVDDSVLDSLAFLGDYAAPALEREFPGRLWVPLEATLGQWPRGRDLSVVTRAFVRMGASANRSVAALLESDDSRTRLCAVLVAAETLSPPLFGPLARRLVDSEESIRQAAVEALRPARHSHELAAALELVERAIGESTLDGLRRRDAVRALGELGDAHALGTLLGTFSLADADLAHRAHEALVALTRHDFGTNPKAWQVWSKSNAGRHRIEWIIDALSSDVQALRTAAFEELKRTTQQYVGYHPLAPQRERDRAQQKYRDWWNTTGRARFLG